MSIKKRFDKKLIIISLLLVLIIGIGAVSAADNNTDEKIASSNDQAELSVSNDVKVSSSNESTLGANVEVSGTRFTDLRNAIDGATAGDVIVLNNDIENDISHYILIDVGKSITIEGNGHKIDALGKSGIFFIKGSGVVLNNITFANARNSFPGGDNMMGGAIGWIGSNGIVNNSIFINNIADSGYTESGHGGAIDWIQAEGGKIYNSKFYNNHANLTGGALRVKSSMIIENSEFFYNDAQDGGAIHVVDQGATPGSLANCTFISNTAEDKGGAIYFYSNSMNVIDNYFTQNSARLGGAVFAYANNNLFLDHQTVISNFAEYGGGFYLNTYAYCPVKVRWSEFLNNTAYKLGAGVYYNDTTNHVGYSDVDALNSDQNTMRDTVHGDKGYLNWIISGWQNPVIETFFGGSIDNYLGVKATPNNTDVAIDVSIPKDADKASANIVLVIKDESGIETTYRYDSSDSRWNYDDVNHSARTVVTLYLTNQAVGEYYVTATFKDNLYYTYERKGNTTYKIEGSKIKGNFTILQELIDEAINTKSYVVDLDRDYTYSIGLDHGQMNIYDNLTINGNGHFLDALSKCRIFSITGNNNVTLNNIVFRNGNASGADGTLSNYNNGGAILWSSGYNTTVNNCTFTNNNANYGGALYCSNIANIYINDTVFSQNTASSYGGGAYLIDNDKVTISNSTFKFDYSNHGSALYCNGNNYDISLCDFVNNTARSQSTIEWVGNNGRLYGSNFTNNKASKFTAITLHGSNGAISHCLFNSNNATNGDAGAIMVFGMDTTIDNCSFTNNYANGDGGCIMSENENTHIYDSTFKSNYVGHNGGAIYFKEPNLIVYNSTFEFNQACWMGGAIAATEDPNNAKNAIISNCTFKSNYIENSDGYGGAICYMGDYAPNKDNLTVFDCIFESNSVLGITLPGSSAVEMYSCGGAIYFLGDMLKIDNCNFTSNCVTANYVAKYYSSGGAVAAYGSNGIISNSQFESNVALANGGAIEVRRMNDINIFNCGFESNWADNGGALNLVSNGANISNCTFEFNNASLGSAIKWEGDGGKVSSSTFLDNKADSIDLLIDNNDLTLTVTLVGNDNYINAIHSSKDLTFTNVTYYNGQIVNSNDVAPVKSQNEAGQPIVLEFNNVGVIKKVNGKTDINGQFIYDYSVLDAADYSCVASHPENTYYTAIDNSRKVRFGEFDLLQHHVNQASDNSILTLVRNYTYIIGLDSIKNGVVINKKNLTINGNNHTVNALNQSRIFLVNSEDVVLNNITYKNGDADDYGGAIYVNASATNLVISNATFENNFANIYGGAVFWNSSSGNINYAIFRNNRVSGSGSNGGAVYWNDTYCNISYTNFTGSSAQNNGGALYSNADTTELDHVNFTNNRAGNNGGAAWIKSDSSITNSNFINNNAANGGAIWADAGECKLNYVNFTSNHANGDGGAIAIRGSSAEISNAKFNEDYTGDEGGAIYITTPNSRIEDSAFEGTHAKNGGAIYWDGLTGTIDNVTFIGTYSTQNGGAVYWNAADGTMTLTNFTDAHSGSNGGAIYWLGDNGKVNDANFTNTYALNGGAIYWTGNNGTVSKSRFNSTKSTGTANSNGGGAIYWKSSNGNITESNFTNTSASSNGGAILLDSNAQTLANISIDNSKASKDGGAIYLSSGAANANLTNIDIFNTTASNGGGLYVNAIDVEFSNSNITNSSANNGGAIYWLCSGGNAYGINLSNNTAQDGGALYATSKSGDTKSTNFTGITFDNNKVTGYGGAICFNKDAGGYAVYNSTFTDNTADQKGNSIYYYTGSSDNLNNSIYNSNFTGTDHIYIENSMRASLVNNTELNSRNGDYFVYNKGTIALSNNALKNLIVNYGNILTLVTVKVCENKTYTYDDFYFPLNATAVDDNDNTVVSDSLRFVTNHNDNLESEIANDMHIATLVTNKDYYEVNISDVGLKKVNVKIAIINVIGKLGSYTWLQKEIDDCTGDVYNLTTNVTFNPDYDLSIYNIYHGKINFLEGMNFNKTIRFEGFNFTISGLNQARIFTVTANDIIINNTNFINGSTFANGGALNIRSNNAKIANSTFTNNTAATGGAISSVSNSGLTLGNLTFVNNIASDIAAVELYGVSNAQIKDLNFIGNAATNDCGALSYVGSGNVQSLSDCNFINNTAGNNYGAVYVSNVNVDSCNFINNTAQVDYSALYIASGSNALTLTKSNFTGNLANNKATVGIENAKTQVNNCNFTDNEVKSSGSAIYVNAQEVIISNNIFDKNEAGANGTVYFASTSGKILNSNFTNNKALNGAGVYTGTNAGIIISNSSFISNVASVEAGAIYLASQAGKIQYCNFTDNTAVNGGAVVLAGSNQEIGFCKFEGNKASYKGGSVYVKDGLSNTIHDTTFKKSYAFDGGAVYNSGSTGASLWLTNNTFIKNIASHNGGAVYYIVDADGANPVIYRDYLNFTSDGITSEGNVNPQGRTTVTMKSAGSTYQRIVDCLFQDNEDYILNISAKNFEDKLAVVYVYNPKDGDEKTIRVVITVNSTGKYYKQIIINETNYDYYFNTYSKSFEVNFEDLVNDTDYNVTVSFEDAVYLYKLNSTTFHIAHGNKIGDFKYLQELINNAIATAPQGTIPTLDLPRNIVFTIGTEIWCDDSCVNITKPITINGLGRTIDALGQSRIFNITSANVTLNDIKFVNGNSSGRYGDGVDMGGAIFWSGQNGTLMNGEFRDNNATIGGAIYYNSTASNAKISGSYFFNNTAVTNGGAIDCNASEMNLTNTFFESNYAGEYGAALCRETNATGGFGRNNNFTSNNAGIAGAALGWMGVNNITITNYIFIDNTAGEKGGAIYVSQNSDNCKIINSSFTGNNVTGTASGLGGAIDFEGANGTIIGSNFTNNHAYGGGAIYVGALTGYTNITGATFTNNGAVNYGGAINLIASSVTVNESNFYDNYAVRGGALYVGGDGHTNYIYSSLFKGNKAISDKTDMDGFGGAIDWVASSGYIIESEFIDNCADNGGGVYFGGRSHESKIERCNFTNNQAKYNGGAIDCNASKMYLTNTLFDGNVAQFGAALCREIHAKEGSGENNTFINNHAIVAGAALAWMGSVGINITNYTFINNSADVAGGAIYVSIDSHNCSVVDCNFEDNYVTNKTKDWKGRFNWVAWDDSNMYYRSEVTDDSSKARTADMNYDGTIFYYQTPEQLDAALGTGGAMTIFADNATIKNSNFTGGSARLGGGIYVGADSGSTQITNSIFKSNVAWERGGAVNLYASGVHIDQGQFYDNLAINGSALYVGGVGTQNKVHESIFSGNNATSYGGGIYWIAYEGEIRDSEFISNSAEYGGGIYLNGKSANTNITNTKFKFNNAVKNGGAIDCNATQMNLTNTFFESNYAGEYGAALCREANATGGHGKNNTFISNHAGISGAALAWLNVENIHINNYTFIDNTAERSGGAIYISKGSDNCVIFNSTFKGNHLTNMTAYHNGGAIDCVGDNLTVNMSSFENNGANTGGAIYVGTGSSQAHILASNFTSNYAYADGGAIGLKADTLIINESIFKSNTAIGSGGAVYVGGIGENNTVHYSVFEDNQAGNHGGAIDWLAKAGEIIHSNFTKNSAEYGGAVYLNGVSSKSRISDVIFKENTATENGGAIDCNATEMNLTHTKFISNIAKYGAGLCRESGATGGFGGNNTFDRNHAYVSGAALAWLDVDNIHINNYTFTNNTADFSGGAIYVSPDSHNCVVQNSTFTDNFVTSAIEGRGGAIDWQGDNATVEDTTFYRCISVNGGGIYFGENSHNASVFNTTFTLCESLTNGGAIVVNGNDASITYCNFTSSVAMDNGGAIAGFDSNNSKISNCNFKYNVAAGHIDPQGNHHGEGGAIYWENSNNLRVAHSTFETDEAKLSGGSISADNCNDSIIYNITTFDETAFRNGGAVAWSNSRNVIIDGSYFNDSGANYDGGTIYLSNVDAATIKNTGINSTWASWGIGGGVYVDGNVTIDNVTFNDTHSYYDNATAIYFNSGISSVINSAFTYSIKSMGIAKDANVTLIKNNITSDTPTKHIRYLIENSTVMVNTVDYAVWNNGNLWLDKNNFDNVIFNDGTIWTKTYISVLDNETHNTTWNETFVFYADITDDNNNTIISVKSLDTGNNITSDRFHMSYNQIILRTYYQGSFLISGYDSGLKNSEMSAGTLNVKMPVNVDVSIKQPTTGNIEITATITPKVQSNYTINGQTIFFKIGDQEFNTTINCPLGPWNMATANYQLNGLHEGKYTITATYNGDIVHLNATGENSTDVILRDSWINVVIQNITYGQTAVAVVTTNSNGTVRINIHGKDQIVDVVMHKGADGNYTGSVNIPVSDYITTGRHDAGVVLEANEYYKSSTNITSFYVSKLNTTIVATPTTPIVVGDKEVIIVKVNETAKGFVKITINGKNYYEELENGIATFEIHNLPRNNYRGIDVEYLGNEYFNGNSTKTTFYIGLRNDYTLYVRIANITYGENATLYASLPVDVDNGVIFIVNNTPYPNINVMNGVAELVIPGLDVGEYHVTVVYNGDDKYDYKSNQTTFHVKPTGDWILNMTVEAHIYGQDTIFNVTLPKNVTKNINLTIEGVNYTVTLINGTGNLTLNNISGGFHAVVATYDGDARYLAKTNSTLFYIERAQSNVNLTQDGRNVTATVTTNATGWVKFIVNGKEQRVQIVNGNATWANVLINGNNTVVAIYEGDINFTDSNNNTNFTVSLEKSFINVTATNVTYGNASVITVKVPAVQTGYVTVVVNNGTDIIRVILPIPATGEIKLDASGLNVGEYKVNVTYLGDKIYDVSQNSTTFNITKANLTADVIAQNVTVDENASFVITVNNDFKGKVDITVNGVSHFDNLAQALIYINKLPANDYVARMTFYDDGNYNNKTINVPFTVSRVDLTVINVTIDDTTYPDKAVAYVNVTGASGVINITVDGKVFNGTLDNNGIATIDLTGLSAGVKEALVNFTSTDAYHNNASTIVKFVVFKAKSQVNLTNESTSVVAKVTDGATGTVTFYVNGRNNTVPVANGYARWDNVLEIGNNTVVVVYNGDKNFNVSTNSTSNFTIPKHKNSAVNVTAINVTYGNASVITVEVPKVQTGYVRIVVEGTAIDVTVPIDPTTGVAKFNATGLDVGRYRVNVTYLGDNLYDVAGNFTYFNITKANLNATVIPINVTVKEYPGFIVSVNNDFNGKVNITIENVNKYADVVKPLIDIDKLLAGKYTANVTFYGDNNYIDTSLKVNFTVSKLGSMMVVTEVVNGTSVVVSLPENATGNVTVVFENGTSMVVNVTNGSAIINLENVTPGTQNITVIYSGDENYTGVTINSTITVPKHDTEIKIDVTDITDNGTAIVHVKVPTNATGDINVTIDGITYSGPINKGEAIIPVANLTSGTKTVIAEYAGDNNYSANYSVAKFDINVKTNVTPTVIDYGNGTVVVVVGDNATGNVTIKVGDKEFNATVVNGTAIVNITNVTPGDHEVEVIYSGDGNHTNATVKANITAPKYDTPINVDVGSIVNGTAVVTVTVPKNATGNVTVRIDGMNYTAKIDGGKATIKFENLTSGAKTFVVEYPGDNNYAGNYTVGEFVAKGTKAVVDPVIIDNGNGTVVVVVGDNATGNVTIKVGNETFNATVVNGTAIINITNVTPGTHEVEVIYSGDPNHTNSTIKTNITAPKYDAPMNVIVSDIVNGTAVVTVTVPENATGNVTIRIDGMNYTAKIDNGGKAVIKLENLTGGAKTFIVEYPGDNNFTGNYTVGEFVAKGTKASVDPVIIDNGNGTIVVVIGDNATGNVTIKVGNETFNATVVNGTAIINITNVTPGNHEVEVIYSGDDNHTNATIKTNVTAPKYDAPMNITVGEAKEGEPIVITVEVPKGATGNVTVSVGGKDYTAKIDNDGKAVVTAENVSDGDHTIVAVYTGDGNYTSNSIISNMSVQKAKADTEPNIVDYGNGTVVVVIGDNATGNVTIKVGDNIYNATVINGTAVVTIDNETPGSHEVEVIYSGDANHTNSTIKTNITAPKYDAPMDVVVSDVVNGTAVVTVTVPKNASGNVTVRIDGMNYTAKIDNDGKAVIKLENLTGGAKTFIVEYPGDNNFTGNYTVGEFVAKGTKAVVDPVIVDNGNGTIVVVIGDNATGNVTIKVGNETFNATVVNGTAIINITNVTPGTHEVEVIYSGDDNHTGSNITTNVTVPKYDTPINVTVGEAKEGEPIIITVEVPKGATGNVTVSVGGKDYTAEIGADGKAVVTAENVSDGDHTIAVEYLGDKNYSANHTVSNMTVQKAKTDTEPSVIDYGNGTVVVVVGDNATGNVTIKVGDKEFNATVVNGTAVVTIDNVTPGTHEVEVIYSGDGNHTGSNITTNVTAPKYDTNMSMTVTELPNGTVVVTVTVPDNAAGDVTVNVGGKEYITKIDDNGNAVVYVDDISSGDHTIVVEYSGDDNYAGNYTISNFTKKEGKAAVDPVIVDYGNGTIVVVVGDNATGNVTVKVGDNIYNATVINGTAIITLDNETPGVHDVEVIYSGDGNHTNATIHTEITVSDVPTPIKINVDNINVGDKSIITVEVPKGATGSITIEIDGVNHTSLINDGVARFEVENLTAGEKSVFAVYEGDGAYARNFTSDKFVVSKVNSNLIVEISDVNVGENITVTVKVPTDATGQVLIDIDGVGYYMNITDGIGTVEIPHLGEGNYNVNLTYLGDDKYLSSSNKTTVKVSKLPSFVIPNATDIHVGENVNIHLIVPTDATGNVTVIINSDEFTFNLNNGALGAVYVEGKEYIVAVSGGNGELVISGLPKGEYSVRVIYNGDKKYLPSENATIFTVSKQDTQMDVIDQGNGTIKVILPDDATGNVTVSDGNNTYVVEVINGTAVITLNDTTPGKHDITVEYSGDGDYSSNKTTISVDIPKYSTPISVNVHNIKVGETEVVTVTLPKEATGTVTIEINGKEYLAKVKDGVATFSVTGLAFGDKTVAVKYAGDDYYMDNYTTAQFTVSKVSSTVKATGKDINVGKDEIITATVPKDATGRVLVDIDGVGYYGTVENGKAKIIIPELASGKYTTKITYEGDDKYLPSTTTVSFKVSKVNAPISADADDIYHGEDATVVVNVPEDATGTVTITVNGKTYTQEVKNGKAIFTVPGLTKGDYDIIASYSGDRKYDANDSITDIEVHFNETPDEPAHPHYTYNAEKRGLEKYPTGNPILALILMLLIAVGFGGIRKFRK